MAKLKQINNPELREALVNYAIIDKVRQMPFFNDDSKSPEILLAERAKLLGCVNIVKDEKTNEFKFKGVVDLGLTNVNLKTWYYDLGSRNYTHDEKIAMFYSIQFWFIFYTIILNKQAMIYGYIRVSTDKQTIENQRYEINQFCEKKYSCGR